MQFQTVFLAALGMAGGLVMAAPAEELPTGTAGVNITKVLDSPQSTCITLDYLGWIDMNCDYYDGLGMNEGAHKKCATYCAELGDHVPDCYDARCKQRAWQHGDEGQCYCPCGTRVVCYA